MMLKVLTCDCLINHLADIDSIELEVPNRFEDCDHFSSPHEVVATKCGFCRLNFSRGFFRNYFPSVKCSCAKQDKDKTCKHCERFCDGLTTRVAKVCIKKEDFVRRFVYYKIQKYLSDLPDEAFFV